uniref:Uncharacterized protein LOC110208186 n=1 Tax=Phascolarctos cinereus TaxID=38626 RepID=A0A6P5KAB2_PHACI|nr:uncharacterized protein LOC110208186 [Phascolarctos cinereus]XP_020841731.1 uncharacterized protein LOC110208186 [Phascolarctos cinereus]XP_020841732.1 uncharacterized protein LOC110208186 [Phascolarctos cinereus]
MFALDLDTKDTILPGSDGQVTPPFIPDLDQAKTEDIPNPNIQTLPAGLKDDEKMSHTIDKQAVILTGQDPGALRLDQQEKPLRGLDCGSTSSSGPDQQDEDIQDFTEQKPWEAKPPKAIILIDQDPRSRPLGLDQEDKTQTGLDPLATLPLRMEHKDEETTPSSTVHFSIQIDQEKLETVSPKPDSLDTILTVWEDEEMPVMGLSNQDNIAPGPENQLPVPASPDHQDKDILDHNAHVLFLAGLNHWGTISQGIEQQLMEPIDWDFWESPLSLSIGTQEITLSDSAHWGDTPPPHHNHQTAYRPDSNTLTSPQREKCWKTILQGSDHKATTSSDQDHRASIPPLTSGPQDKILPPSDPQTTLQTNLEHWDEIIADPISHVSLQMEQEPWEMAPLRTDHQDTTLSNQGCTRPPVNLDWKGNTLSGINHQSISPTSPDKQPEDSTGPFAQVLLQTEQQDPETMATHQGIAPAVQNHQSAQSSDSQYSIPLDPTPEATLPPSPNKQNEDTQVLIIHPSLPTEPEFG